MTPTYSMDCARLCTAFPCSNEVSEVQNQRFEVLDQIGADAIGPIAFQWGPKCSFTGPMRGVTHPIEIRADHEGRVIEYR